MTMFLAIAVPETETRIVKIPRACVTRARGGTISEAGEGRKIATARRACSSSSRSFARRKRSCSSPRPSARCACSVPARRSASGSGRCSSDRSAASLRFRGDREAHAPRHDAWRGSSPASSPTARSSRVEGSGLWLGKRWGEWLTIVATTSFIPFEIYELMERATAVRAAFLAANLAIVIYLIWRIRKENAGARTGITAA